MRSFGTNTLVVFKFKVGFRTRPDAGGADAQAA